MLHCTDVDPIWSDQTDLAVTVRCDKCSGAVFAPRQHSVNMLRLLAARQNRSACAWLDPCVLYHGPCLYRPPCWCCDSSCLHRPTGTSVLQCMTWYFNQERLISKERCPTFVSLRIHFISGHVYMYSCVCVIILVTELTFLSRVTDNLCVVLLKPCTVLFVFEVTLLLVIKRFMFDILVFKLRLVVSCEYVQYLLFGIYTFCL